MQSEHSVPLEMLLIASWTASSSSRQARTASPFLTILAASMTSPLPTFMK